MKILAIGDFHGTFPKKLKKLVSKVDFVLCTGDFGGSEELLKIIFKYLGQKWWEIIGEKKARKYTLEDYNSGKKIIDYLGTLNKPIYIVPGNWDFISKSNLERTSGLNLIKYQKLVRNHKNLKWFNRGIKKVNGLKILAFGGIVTAREYINKNGFFKNKKRKLLKNIKENNKEIKQIMSYGANNVDILFAHYPPYGYFDVVKFKGENPMNGKHVGFRGYTNYIKKYHPLIFICGHMHEYQGLKKIGKTNIIATGSAKEGKAAIIEIDDKTKKIKSVKFVR